MDEPTNHLDIKSKNVLKEALKNFTGTLIVVSHDRDFLQGLTNKVYEFKDHRIKEYLGDIDYFLEQRNLQNLREAEKKSISEKKPVEKAKSGKEAYEEQKKSKSLQNKLSKTEAAIHQLEKEIKEIDVELAVNYEKTISQSNFFEQYESKKNKLQKLMTEWEQITLQIDELN